MAILIIEGDLGTIEHLSDELWERNYISETEFNSAILDSPDLQIADRWTDFLYQLKYLIQKYIYENAKM